MTVDETQERNLIGAIEKRVPKALKATLKTVLVGTVFLGFWLLLSSVLAGYPEYLTLFSVLAWGLIFFTFVISVTEGTMYKFGLVIARSLFLIIYTVYATNLGTLSFDMKGFHLTVEFTAILGLTVVVSLLVMAKGMLEALEFTSESPRD
jgi:hypothetical protein